MSRTRASKVKADVTEEVEDTEYAMDGMFMTLDDVWPGYTLRGSQEEVMRKLLVEKKSTLCVMPTGGGKSLCFQLPALCLPGLTLVISPLISLMKDQVDGLKARGVAAAQLDSSLSIQETMMAKNGIKDKTLKILYVAPERLNNELFIEMIRDHTISLLAVDEAHSIDAWGPSFRADYLKVARFAVEMRCERVLALTATATPATVQGICDGFDIEKSAVFISGSFRSNLSIIMRPAQSFNDKMSILVPFLKSRQSGGAIVYVTTQQNAVDVADGLNQKGVKSKIYHAGMPAADRKAVQESFMSGKDEVICATIAFGMGIDKSDIRQIAHFMLPKTLEGYSQEIGRAGRDGLPSDCLMLPSTSDVPVLQSFARSTTPSLGSIKRWFESVVNATPAADGTLDFSAYEQERAFDIKTNTLGLLNAQLELQHEFTRAITPFYCTFTLKPLPTFPAGWNYVVSEKSPAASAIHKFGHQGPTWLTVDVLVIARAAGLDRSDIAKQVSRWEAAGLCEVKASGVRQRFALLKPFPRAQKSRDAIAVRLFEQLEEREEADVVRLFGVCDFIASKGCLAHQLALYFGDSTSVPNGECEMCSYCTTKRACPFVADIPPTSLAAFETRIRFVLGVCGVRDDGRFLARLAFGISSPRITQLGISKHAIFGCCSDADFRLLVARFEQECEEKGFQNRAVLVDPKDVTKPPAYGRAASTSTSSGAGVKRSYNAGTSRGSYPAKRGRGGSSSSRGSYSRGSYSRGSYRS